MREYDTNLTKMKHHTNEHIELFLQTLELNTNFSCWDVLDYIIETESHLQFTQAEEIRIVQNIVAKLALLNYRKKICKVLVMPDSGIIVYNLTSYGKEQLLKGKIWNSK